MSLQRLLKQPILPADRQLPPPSIQGLLPPPRSPAVVSDAALTEAPETTAPERPDHPAPPPQTEQRSRSSRIALHAITPALQFGFGQHERLAPADAAPLDGLAALKQAAQKRDQRRAAQAQAPDRDQGIPKFHSAAALAHAAPLSPLRDRDLQVLADWFAPSDMAQIEADIADCLRILWPAPYWDAEAFEFLGEFMQVQA